MLTITVAVGLLRLGSITVDAASYEYSYITALTDTSGNTVVYLSQDPIHVFTSGKTTLYDSPYFYYIGAVTSGNILELVYNTALSQWQTNAIHTAVELDNKVWIFGSSTNYYNRQVVWLHSDLYSNSIYQKYSIVINSPLNTYEQGMFTSYSNDLTQLPQGLTEDAIREIINEQLNSSTESGQAAQTIINETTNNYNLYLTGDITSAQMQSYVIENLDTLSELTPSTLLDAMQINNAMTYNQSIQDQLLNNASSDCASAVSDIWHQAYVAYWNFQEGNLTQEQVQEAMHYYIRDLVNLYKDGTYTTTADLQLIQSTINAVQGYIDSIANYSELDPDVSDKSQASDQAELDYLDDLTAETTATVEQIAPSKNFTASQTGEMQEVLNLIWENEFVKRLLPMCAGFMVLCVVLGIRYKV